jgi:hypothetical protein
MYVRKNEHKIIYASILVNKHTYVHTHVHVCISAYRAHPDNNTMSADQASDLQVCMYVCMYMYMCIICVYICCVCLHMHSVVYLCMYAMYELARTCMSICIMRSLLRSAA